MFGKTLSTQEKEQFLSIALPGKKNLEKGEKGRILYALKKGKLNESDLKEIFPKEYKDFKELKKKQGKILGFFDKTNYVHKYFFTVYNRGHTFKVKPAKVVGFKAERKGGENQMNAKVKYSNGRIEEKGLEIFPGVKIDLNLNNYVLVHRGAVCQKITEEEYEKILEEYC